MKFKIKDVTEEMANNNLSRTEGSSTGEEENAIEAGGWEGTDDATSTAPSDLMSWKKPESEITHEAISDITGHEVAENWKDLALDDQLIEELDAR